jgi:beta,beta-carotene 9',10'-dioxygenase
MTMTSSTRPLRHSPLFDSLASESTSVRLPVDGTLPSLLAGCLYAVGPARFEIGRQHVHHLYDGAGMIHRLTISDGAATYSSRYVGSDYYRQMLTMQLIPPCSFFGTRAGIFRRILRTPAVNPVVGITLLQNKIEVLGQTGQAVQIDPESLATIGTRHDDVPGSCWARAPHGAMDHSTHEQIRLTVTRRDPFAYTVGVYGDSGSTRTLRVLPVSHPALVQGIGCTEHYIAIVEPPFRARRFGARWARAASIHDYSWDATEGTHVTILDRATGSTVAETNVRSLFTMDRVTAWEEGQTVTVELAAYPDPSVIDSLAFVDGRTPPGEFPSPMPTRIVVDLASSTGACSPISQVAGRMLASDPRLAGHKHSVIFFDAALRAGDLPGRLVRLNVESGALVAWQDEHLLPSMPLLVPAGSASPEATGWLVSMALDVDSGTSLLVVLDADTMTEIARVCLPQAIPYGLNGLFIPAEAPT